MAPQSSLYLEALAKFREMKEEEYAARKDKDRQILHDFLRKKGSPEEAQRQALVLKNDAGKKYGSRNVGSGVEIPREWIDNVLSNIGNFITLGDMATTGAPESVGLAWYAMRLTLSAIQNNYALYNLFGSGLSDISEIMIIIPHYDRLYDERDRQKSWKPDALVEKLFKEIVQAYTAVLDFSLSVDRHLQGGFTDKLRHGIKDLLGGQQDKFQQKLQAIAVIKQKILEDCNAAFQGRALQGIEGMQDVVGGIETTVKQIISFQPELKRMHDEQMEKLKQLEDHLDEKIDGMQENIKAWARPKTPWEHALHGFQKIVAEILKPIDSKKNPFLSLAHGEGRANGTCEWVFNEWAYQQWEEQTRTASLLSVVGEQGTGKSTLMSVITNKVLEGEAKPELLYVSCTEFTGADGSGRHASSICYTLLYQLYVLAKDSDDQDTNLLESCNKAFQNTKSTTKATEKGGKPAVNPSFKDESLPDFASTFKKLADLIKVDTLVVVDAADSVPKGELPELVKNLAKLLDTFNVSRDSRAKLRMLVGAVRHLDLEDQEQEHWSINMSDRNGPDIDLKLSLQLKQVPGLSADEQNIAKEAIKKKADSIFSYVDKAIKFMREPLQRPIETHLESLPEVGTKDKYNEELRKMGPNYARLLHRVLTWSLLSVVPLNTEVVMEDYNGVYDNDSVVYNDTNDDGPGFPPSSILDIEQLTEASGPFFSLLQDQGTRYIQIENVRQIEEYCFDKALHQDSEHWDNERMLCARCRGEVSEKTSLHISKEDGHLNLAITCLKHLNNPLFQRRAGLLQDDKKSGSDTPLSGEQHIDGVKPNDANATNEMENAEAPGEQVNEPDAGAPGLEPDEAQEKGSNTNSGYDTDDSLDDEDRDTHPDLEDFSGDQNDVDSQDPRYEVQYWPHHIRIAEDLWSPEERAHSKLWAELFQELDKLAYDNRPIFDAWQKKYRKPWTDYYYQGAYLEEPRPPIHVAAYFGLASLVDHLTTKRNEDVNAVSGECNAIQAAAIGTRPAGSAPDGKPDALLELLLQKGADINAETEKVVSAFHIWLAKDPSVENVGLMLDHGADPTVQDKVYGRTALDYFATRGTDPAVLELLTAKGVNINAADKQGYTPLLTLLLQPEVPLKLLKAFIEKKANVNAEETSYSIRPLWLASLWGDIELVKTLLDAGIEDIDDVDGDGETALYQAAVRGFTPIVRLLAEKGANPNHPSKRGRAALHAAAWNGHQETVECLLEKGAELNAVDKHGRTPFFFACLGESEEIAVLILDKLLEIKLPIAEINKPTARNRSALRQAASHGFKDIVKKLVEAAKLEADLSGLAIDLQDDRKGMTALHRAAWNGHLETVRLLLDAGADHKLEDAEHRTALSLAYDKWTVDPKPEIEELVSILIDKDPQAAKTHTQLPGICAVNGSKKLLMQLRDCGANLNIPDKYGWTPMDLAIKFGQKEAELYFKQYFPFTGKWEKTASQKTTISEDGLKVLHTSKERMCMTTDKPLPSGLEKYYYEITINDTSSSKEPPSPTRHMSNITPPLIAIGFCTLGGTSIDFPGWCSPARAPGAKSWGYHSDDGGMFMSSNTNSTAMKQGKEQRYWPGDTVGCGVDLSNNTMWFTRNGKKWDFSFVDVRGRLFPVLGLRDDIEVDTNFFGPFKWVDGEQATAM